MDLRFLMFLAFAGMLILLRFDAARFGAAEYHDAGAVAGWRPGLRRLTWYLLGGALAVAVYRLYQQPISVLHLSMGSDRTAALLLGIGAGVVGIAFAFAFAVFRLRSLRLPSLRQYPGGIANSIGTAVVDEVAFRGVVLGLLLAWNWPVELALAFQTILYGLATRLGAPGRSLAMLGVFLTVGAIAGVLTVITGGIAAGFLGHAITRFALFITAGHAGQLASGRAAQGATTRPDRPEGWEAVRAADRREIREA